MEIREQIELTQDAAVPRGGLIGRPYSVFFET